MRILIGLHHVTLGGDTINAVEIADRLNRRGHVADLFALVTPGIPEGELPLLAVAANRDVRVWTFRTPTSLVDRMRLVVQLSRFARAERYDVVHTFGHQDTYYAFLGTYGLAGVPLVVNDYAMDVTAGLPRRVPLVVGTREVQVKGRSSRVGPTLLVEPPVDLDANRPGAVDPRQFRRQQGIDDGEILLVAVSRLARALKSESLYGAIEAVRLLRRPSLRLVIVGDGAERPGLQRRADSVNDELGYEAVGLPGPMTDPRPAYAAADVVLGMGHSGLRGMAFGKPLVMLGERGFSAPLADETVAHLEYFGVYGVGRGEAVGPELARILEPLVADPALRACRGQLGRRLAAGFGLDVAAESLERIYAEAMSPRSLVDWVRDAAGLAGTYLPAKARHVATGLAR
jgi:glycosyltransferase involved in cell wall biosynthesis